MRHSTSWLLRMASTLDSIYSSVVHSLSSEAFFRRGWGDISALEPQRFAPLIEKLRRAPLRVAWTAVETGEQRGHAYEVLEGRFESPCAGVVPDLPQACHRGRLWLMRPVGTDGGRGRTGMRGCVIQLPATGEHQPLRRLQIAKPLLERGIGTIVLEGPFYGARRPPAQSNSKLLHVSDLIKLGSVTVAESLSILAMLRASGVTRVAVAGWSMGGVHACMVNALHPEPLACVAMVTPRSAADAYCEGALAPFTSVRALRETVDAHGVDLFDCVAKHLTAPNSFMPGKPYILRMLDDQPCGDVAQVAWRREFIGARSDDSAPGPSAQDVLSTDASTSDGFEISGLIPRPGQLSTPRKENTRWRAPWQLPTDEAAELAVTMLELPRALTGAAAEASGASSAAAAAAANSAEPQARRLSDKQTRLLRLSPHLQSLLRVGERQSRERGRQVWHAVASVLTRFALRSASAASPEAAGEVPGAAPPTSAHQAPADAASTTPDALPFYEINCLHPLIRPDSFGRTCLRLAAATLRGGESVGSSAAAPHTPPRWRVDLHLYPRNRSSAARQPASSVLQRNEAPVDPASTPSKTTVSGPSASAYASSASAGGRDLLHAELGGSAPAESGGDAVGGVTGHGDLATFDRHVSSLAGAGPSSSRTRHSGRGAGRAGGARLSDDALAKMMLSLVLETFTDITRFPRPVCPGSAVFVAATEDAYVPFAGSQHLQQYWRGSQLWTISGGHVSSFMTANETYREAIVEALDRLDVHPSSGHTGPPKDEGFVKVHA